MDYTTHVNPRGRRKKSPQNKKVPGKNMVKNTAGGFAFEVDEWDRLDRFLVLGTEGGTYYATERKLTVENAKNVKRLIDHNGVGVVERVVEVSQSGRAPKNDPALFVLAMAASSKDARTRKAALDALPKVARIGTHLFHFAQFVGAFRGWGRGLRRAVGDWYNEKDLDNLVYQLVKYKQRDGWSHRDLLRLSHPSTTDEMRNELYKWVTQKDSVDLSSVVGESHALGRLEAAERLATETDPKKAVKLITEYNLPREVLNTSLLDNKKVWEALLEKMPMTAMVRNLGKMSSIGLLGDMSDASRKVVERLTSEDVLRKARIHPLSVLTALNTYNSGGGFRGKLTWKTNQDIVDALDEAFYLAFGNVESTGKRFLLGIDVSGSMSWGQIAGMAGITPNVAAAAMAMVTARTEKDRKIMGFAHDFRELGITPRQRLDTVIKKTQGMSFGGTDCALPMVYAQKNNLKVDAFVVYTDNETWCGAIHPFQALQEYRNKTGIPAKLVVVGMTASNFSIADSDDAGMLDVVGFDTAAPNIINSFIDGEI